LFRDELGISVEYGLDEWSRLGGIIGCMLSIEGLVEICNVKVDVAKNENDCAGENSSAIDQCSI
jgi:hypothetical protein